LRRAKGRQQSQGIQEKCKITNEGERKITANNQKSVPFSSEYWEKLQRHESCFTEVKKKNCRMSNMAIKVKNPTYHFDKEHSVNLRVAFST